MTETESLITEVRLLRADVARLHAAMQIRHRWMRLLFKDLSTNPHTQYKVHMWGAIYWLINFPLICCLFFFTPTLWVKLGIFITLIYSIYANLATDYGAMSAAEAAFLGRHSRRRSHSSRRRRCRHETPRVSTPRNTLPTAGHFSAVEPAQRQTRASRVWRDLLSGHAGRDGAVSMASQFPRAGSRRTRPFH